MYHGSTTAVRQLIYQRGHTRDVSIEWQNLASLALSVAKLTSKWSVITLRKVYTAIALACMWICLSSHILQQMVDSVGHDWSHIAHILTHNQIKPNLFSIIMSSILSMRVRFRCVTSPPFNSKSWVGRKYHRSFFKLQPSKYLLFDAANCGRLALHQEQNSLPFDERSKATMKEKHSNCPTWSTSTYRINYMHTRVCANSVSFVHFS